MNELKQTFGEHLEVLRKMLIRIIVLVIIITGLIFCYKETIFNLVLAPCNGDFVTFNFIRNLFSPFLDSNNLFENNINLITTDISSQFVNHITISLYLGFLVASPFVLYELMKFIAPALYAKEKKYAAMMLVSAYLLFCIGLLVSYYILFPISSRFLITYNVSPIVTTMATLDSFISLFISLSFLLGIVFEMPILCFILCKMGILNELLMIKYRKYAFVLILVMAAIITPSDIIMTQVIVALPLYFLYEISIKVIKMAK